MPARRFTPAPHVHTAGASVVGVATDDVFTVTPAARMGKRQLQQTSVTGLMIFPVQPARANPGITAKSHKNAFMPRPSCLRCSAQRRANARGWRDPLRRFFP